MKYTSVVIDNWQRRAQARFAKMWGNGKIKRLSKTDASKGHEALGIYRKDGDDKRTDWYRACVLVGDLRDDN